MSTDHTHPHAKGGPGPRSMEGPPEGTARQPEGAAGPPAAGRDDPGTQAQGLLPSTSAVVQAGAFGAALGGISTGVTEMARVRMGETTSDEAIRTVASASAQSAATMAVATVASHIVRARPVFGLVALAAAGVGAFLLLSKTEKKPPRKTAPKAKSTPPKPAAAPSTKATD